MKPGLLFYRQLLCGALGGLDNYAERAMVRRLILRIDSLEAVSKAALAERAEYWQTQYPLIMRICLACIVAAIIALACLLMTGRAVEISISGHSTGTGLHTLSFAGDLINASILQGNNSTWLINATGAA